MRGLLSVALGMSLAFPRVAVAQEEGPPRGANSSPVRKTLEHVAIPALALLTVGSGVAAFLALTRALRIASAIGSVAFATAAAAMAVRHHRDYHGHHHHHQEPAPGVTATIDTISGEDHRHHDHHHHHP